MSRATVLLAFPALVVASLAALVARIAGAGVPGAALAAAGLVLAAGSLVAAALLAAALARRQWAWAAALLLAWPLAVPLYLRRARRRSEDPEV